MLPKEMLDFCDFYAISIRKFLQENFNVVYDGPKYNKKNQKWRTKHSEIEFLTLVIPVSMKFSMRYQELVDMGKIVIVKDDFGKYQAYVNPKIIMNLGNKPLLEEKLQGISKRIYRLDDLSAGLDQKHLIQTQLDSIEEDERIIRHFSGEEPIDYCKGVINSKNELVRAREKKD